tara:strand:- start:2143 stop:2616 length:474 start_codon:yes stop_codon:yes gene_type:complete
MTSTITAATLTLTVQESIELNGVEQGSTNTQTIASVREVSKRIVTATTAERIILVFGDNIAAGQFHKTKVMYIRITNLDDTNHVGLIFKNEDNDELGVKLDKGQSFIFNGDLAGGVVDTMDAVDNSGLSTNTFGDLVNITATTAASTCDLEVFVACI